MRAVWKYPIKSAGTQIIREIPEEAEILHVGYDGSGQLCLWAVVEVEKAEGYCTGIRRFHVAGTGWRLDEAFSEQAEFLGSVVRNDGCVFHIFELHGEGE